MSEVLIKPNAAGTIPLTEPKPSGHELAAMFLNGETIFIITPEPLQASTEIMASTGYLECWIEMPKHPHLPQNKERIYRLATLLLHNTMLLGERIDKAVHLPAGAGQPVPNAHGMQ